MECRRVCVLSSLPECSPWSLYEPMVLVSDKPSNDIGFLQTKLGNREGHKARRARLEAMPLDQHIKGGHGER